MNFLVHGKRTNPLKIGRGPTRGSGLRVNIVLIFSLILKLGAAPDFKNWEDGAAPSSKMYYFCGIASITGSTVVKSVVITRL